MEKIIFAYHLPPAIPFIILTMEKAVPVLRNTSKTFFKPVLCFIDWHIHSTLSSLLHILFQLSPLYFKPLYSSRSKTPPFYILLGLPLPLVSLTCPLHVLLVFLLLYLPCVQTTSECSGPFTPKKTSPVLTSPSYILSQFLTSS